MKLMNTILASLLIILAQPLYAQESGEGNAPPAPVSICQAIAQNEWNSAWPPIQYAKIDTLPVIKANTSAASELGKYDISITYVGHSTFRIENAEGLTIATDYAGFAGLDVIPDVVTMNHAHGTHFTVAPDSRIQHVMRGWGKDGKPARHLKQIGDTLIRNVTTDIDNQWAGYEPNGNSIFIFEMAGLCIGHLGHLHHLPTDAHYRAIGRLDVLMIPVDGGSTLNLEEVRTVANRVKASIILPMHWFGTYSLNLFLERIKTGFPIEVRTEKSMVVSLRNLPAQPTVIVLQPESIIGNYGLD